MICGSFPCLATSFSSTLSTPPSALVNSSDELSSRIDSLFPRGIRIKNNHCYVNNDSLHLSFDLCIHQSLVAPSKSLSILPVYTQGTKKITFPKVLINGKKRHRYYKREQELLTHDMYNDRLPYRLLVIGSDTLSCIHYSVSRPLPSDVTSFGNLHLQEWIHSCCSKRLLGFESLVLANHTSFSLPPSFFEGHVSFIRPMTELNKKRSQKLAVHLNFLLSDYKILPHYSNNASELARVDSLMHFLMQHKDYKITNASIRGYASPDGPTAFNLQLSRHRANSFKNYLVHHYGLKDIAAFSSEGLSENWGGLRKAVSVSHLDCRDEILALIDQISLSKGREKLLHKLNGGIVYRTLLSKFYSPLRCMDMEVFYKVSSYDSHESELVLNDCPKDLSHAELFDLARTHNSDSLIRKSRKSYGSDYFLAVRYFPQDPISLINASSASLIRGDLKEAWSYLSQVQDNPAAFNNLGLYYWSQSDFVQAESYFKRAINAGEQVATAKSNLAMLKNNHK